MAWTTAQDVLDAWIGDDAPDDLGKVEVWVGRAERLLRREVPDLADRVAAAEEPDLEATIRDVVSEMVTLVFRNPDGARTRQESVGTFAATVTYAGASPGLLQVRPEHLEALTQGRRGRAKVTAFSPIPITSPFHPSRWTT